MAAGVAATAWPFATNNSRAAELTACPIVVFSKIFQELRLPYTESAELTKEAGLDGIDCPVRPGGEVLPERVEEDLPTYAEALRKHNLRIQLLTTAITSTTSPHTEKTLRAAAKIGVRFYRLGFFTRDKSKSFAKQASEIRSGLKDLADMNRDLGVCALFQNHSGSLGADLNEALQVLDDFPPEEVGAAFDLGHALLVHGEAWRPLFDRMKRHLRVAYIKDAKIGGTWVPFGTGDISRTGYFSLLKDLGYSAPFSLHIEFDWSAKGASKNKSTLLKALSDSNAVLRKWVAKA
jgi:sugar phosphate isomerase/epimerase